MTGCGVAKEMFLEQAKDKVRKMTLELGNKDKEIQFYKETHMIKTRAPKPADPIA